MTVPRPVTAPSPQEKPAMNAASRTPHELVGTYSTGALKGSRMRISSVGPEGNGVCPGHNPGEQNE